MSDQAYTIFRSEYYPFQVDIKSQVGYISLKSGRVTSTIKSRFQAASGSSEVIYIVKTTPWSEICISFSHHSSDGRLRITAFFPKIKSRTKLWKLLQAITENQILGCKTCK